MTVKNSQANAMHKTMHLIMAKMLCTQEIKIYEGVMIKEEVRRLLQSVAFVIRTANSLVSKYSPAQAVYGRDMVMHFKELVDWKILWERKNKQHIKKYARK